jgi:N-acetyl-anhydromuramoyl-L-alanine amidase
VEINTQTGLLSGVKHLPSPNCDPRPPGMTPDLIVVHGISLPPGEFGHTYIDDFFINQLALEAHPYFATIADKRVSAHLLIARNGAITQYVPFHQRAWHAGESLFLDRPRCNDFSIGIELEGTDHIPYTEQQYDALTEVVALLLATYRTLSPTRIVGHSDIAPLRKTDPGPAFDWAKFHRQLFTFALNNEKTP